MSEQKTTPEDLNVPAIELMAALSSLLVHDLANHLSVISGNAQFAQLVANDPERSGTALKSILQASELASNLLRRCGTLRRSIGNTFPQSDLAELTTDLSTLSNRLSDWSFELQPQLAGRIVLPSKWIARPSCLREGFSALTFPSRRHQHRSSIGNRHCLRL
jgi:hypothetical protein